MRFWTWSFTALTVTASVATLWPLLREADAAMTRQFYGEPAPSSPAPNAVPAPVSFYDYSARACSLVATDVSAQVSAYTARVTVKQVFHNPNSSKFDAVYSFPLSNTAAVDQMLVKIGGRTIEGSIKKKAEARAVYAAAQARGQTASLLEQARSNIFTQSIANVQPGETVEVTLTYTDTLKYANGKYSFVYPTKIGPRFVPAGSANFVQTESNVNQGRLAFDVNINGGMPISAVASNFTADSLLQPSASTAHFERKNVRAGDDFVLTWNAAADHIESGVVTQREGEHGHLTVMLMPPKRVHVSEVAPKEFVFLVDCSGSQSGPPLQKAKDTLHYIVDHMGVRDTFQIVAFNNSSEQFAQTPCAVSPEMKSRAHKWIDHLEATGGTMVVPAVEKVCAMPAAENRLRIVTFMTDGFVSNDYEVINLVKRLRGNSRWFPFGTGNGVNRTLIDGIAREGGGEPEYVSLDRDGNAIGEEFFARISSPVLTDVKIRFEGIRVQDVYPKAVSDVWAQKPLYFHARYSGWGSGFAVISGFAAGHSYTSRLPISLPLVNGGSAAIGQTWARERIEDLTSQDLIGVQRNAADPTVEKEITDTALQYHLMSHYTSFVAVDDRASDRSATYSDASSVNDVARVQPASVSAPVVSPRARSWNPVQNMLNDSFDQTVSQLNCLNSYSAATCPAAATCSPAAVTSSSTAISTAIGNILRLAGLAVMWAACAWMLFRKRGLKA